MGKLYFKAELLDDVVLSQRTATVGDHKSLDYIPGSVFLGIAASRFYSKMNKEDSWKVFHSSNVRFYNAYPMINGSRAIPMPLSLHSQKVPEIGKEKDVYNFVYPDTKDKKIQYRQNRVGYVSIDGGKQLKIAQPSKTSRMRTAIDAKTGTAAKSQLYGYESLDAGQVFVGKIEWDDSLKDVVVPIESLFKAEEIIHVGRSKTASYGRVRISKIEKPSVDNSVQSLNGTSFSILAVSDLCLKNPVTGTPELNVLPSFLGLGESWTVDKQKSFSRPSCICQYNSYRKEIEMQKTLVSKGSVFTFKSRSNKDLTAEESQRVLSAVENGIGEAKGQGFGEIAVFDFEKEYIKEDTDEKFSCADEVQDKNNNEKTLNDKEQAWLEWLNPVFVSKNVKDEVKNAVAEFVNLCKYIKRSRNFNDKDRFWPGDAQWDRILDAAIRCKTRIELRNYLFEGKNPVIKAITITKTDKVEKEKNPDKEWNYEASQSGETLRNWLMRFVDNKGLNDKEIRIALRELSKRCKDKIHEEN